MSKGGTVSRQRPFSDHTFIIATPAAVMTFPGLHIRAVAVLMREQAHRNPALYIKASGDTQLETCTYQHKTEGLEDGRLFHKATFESPSGLIDEVHWMDPDRHDITVKPTAKMDTPEGLFTANCSCGAYRSGPMTEAAARLAGSQHAVTKTERERFAV